MNFVKATEIVYAGASTLHHRVVAKRNKKYNQDIDLCEATYRRRFDTDEIKRCWGRICLSALLVGVDAVRVHG